MPYKALPLVALVVLASSCKTAPVTVNTPAADAKASGPGQPGAVRLTLVGTNDIHGWVAPRTHKLADGTSASEGGAETLAGYVEILKAENPGGVLLLDGGDLFQGTLASNLGEGKMVVEALNRLRYTATAIGNHEFDYGPSGPVSIASLPEQDPVGALKARMADARFPMLAVNIYDAQSGQRPSWLTNDGTLLLEVKGVKVGIFGLSTPTTPQTTNPVNVAQLRFGSLAPETLTAARKLRERGAAVVILIAHAGGKCARRDNPRDLSSCEPNHEIFDLLKAIPPGTVDAVVAGHTHQPLGHFVGETPVIETAGMGKTFGTIELFLDSHGKVLADRTQLESSVPLCAKVDPTTRGCDEKQFTVASASALVPATYRGKTVQPDAGMKAVLAPFLATADSEQNRGLGVQVREAMGRNFDGDSDLGKFMADSLRKVEQADVALMNSGGLRSNLPAGELTFGRVYEVIPFDNTISTLTLTGEELDRLLHAAYGARRVFQLSGLKVQLSRCPTQDRLRKVTLEDGKPLRMDRKYKVVMPDFLARGGDGLGAVVSSFPPGKIDLGTSREVGFRETLIHYWQRQGKPLVIPSNARVSFLDDAATCASAQAN